MSFRIDDILKKDDLNCALSKRCATTSAAPSNSKVDLWSHFNPVGHCNGNILQQTLQNKPHLPCYSLNDLANVKFCTSLYNCDMLLPLQSLNSYVERGCSSLYSRTRYWPSHGPLPTLFPLSYSHYSKRKGGQVRFTTSQTEALEKRFNVHKYLSPEDRRILANSLKLSDRQVKTWFQNRRAKWRRCNSVSSNSSESARGIYNDDSENELGEVDLSRSATPSRQSTR